MREQIGIPRAAADEEGKIAGLHDACFVRAHQRKIVPSELKHQLAGFARREMRLLERDEPLDGRHHAAHQIAHIHLRRFAARARAGVGERDPHAQRIRLYAQIGISKRGIRKPLAKGEQRGLR